MKPFYLFYLLTNYTIQIQSTELSLPNCKNCVHYRTTIFIDSYYNKCSKFGTKDIFTGIVDYDFADTCRTDETKCGNIGKYYQSDKYIDTKIVLYTLIGNFPNISSLFLFLIVYYYNNYNRK